MDFSLELTEFPSMVHANIYSAARGLTPLERSLTSVAAPEMRLSCKAYHSFILEMLSDMYDYPEAYHLPVGMLEDFCQGKKVNGVKQKFPSKTKNMLAQTRNAVPGYIVLLYMLGRMGMLNNDKLTVSSDVLETINKRVGFGVSPIPLEIRSEALSRVGLVQKNGSFISKRYPNMFPAMCSLALKAEKTSGFDFFAFCNAEFRNIESKYKPTHEDYYNPLVRNQRETADAIHYFAVINMIRPIISTFWKVEYKYKSSQVMCVGTEGDHERLLDIRIVGTYNWENSTLLNDRLEKESPDFQKYILRHIWRCDACATTHLGKFVTVLGKRQRVCGGGQIGFRWRNPTEKDLEAIKKLIQMRCEIIDEIQKLK